MTPDRRKTAAERTGPSAAFNAARSPRSPRGQAIASVIGAAPASVSPDLVAENPENPRQDFDPEYLEQLAQNMREVGQIQAVTVMTRLAYLVVHPEYKDVISPDHDYVIIDGACRLRASQIAGIDLRILVDDSTAGTPEDLLAAALSANHFRKDLTPIEEATALEALVAFHGSAAAVVAVLGGKLTDSWISTRRALLKLPEPVQDRVAAKEIPVALARKAATLPRPEQEPFIAAAMDERKARKDAAPKPVRGRAAAALKKSQPEAAPRTPQSGNAPENPTPNLQSFPEPRPEQRAEPFPPAGADEPIDWTDPEVVTSMILRHCPRDAVSKIAEGLLSSL
ncbi:ParB/RepB/Spo0J family partition protein [Streptomyces sp. NPDC000927]|uniref:ParB/RepB/Spo0J family partition protein n=1 Tax=Streptomyces sp. NPDC000927 TaxID=3154371 RepID=UPI0033266559